MANVDLLRPSHHDQVARAEYQAGADLRSVAASYPDSGWAWAALGAESLQSDQPADAYAFAFLGHVIAFKALTDGGWQEGQPVGATALLAAQVLGLAAQQIGDLPRYERSQTFLAEAGYSIDDLSLLAAQLS
ncbi:MAG: DUF3151 family protein [Bifidobacteriaceae bacterium]|jgi:hypothetical protein|nr:DUF3151 family protein [Bifidobacteriaceae bacterium]